MLDREDLMVKLGLLLILAGTSFLIGFTTGDIISDSGAGFGHQEEVDVTEGSQVRGHFLLTEAEGDLYRILEPEVSEIRDPGDVPAYHVRTNDKGLRDEPFNTTPPENTTRILVIGDSYTFGWKINESDRFTEVLERELERKVPGDYQVINAGVPGWGMKDYYNFLETRGLNYEPDVIVVAFISNDWFSHKEHDSMRKEAEERVRESGRPMRQVYVEKEFQSLKWEKYEDRRIERTGFRYWGGV
ncbi:MAG: SGNH/GDSL hydrolase family protein [Candidatus Nanohaloarchaea archaeon]